MIKNFFGKAQDKTQDKTQEQSDETAVPVVDGQKGTILIVDDSPTEVHIFKKILERQGYRILVASDGKEGVEKAIQFRPDLILMDVVMPVLNGFQATRQLKHNDQTAAIPVIMVTTKDQQTDINWGMRQGANEYLVKPVAPAELLNKIRAVLND